MTRLTLAFLLTAVLIAGCGGERPDGNPQRPNEYNSPNSPTSPTQADTLGEPDTTGVDTTITP